MVAIDTSLLKNVYTYDIYQMFVGKWIEMLKLYFIKQQRYQ